MTPLYHEVHISVEQSENFIRKLQRSHADRYSYLSMFKCSTIVGDEPDVILTIRQPTLDTASHMMVNCIIDLTRANVVVTRHKIETTVIDSAYQKGVPL